MNKIVDNRSSSVEEGISDGGKIAIAVCVSIIGIVLIVILILFIVKQMKKKAPIA